MKIQMDELPDSRTPFLDYCRQLVEEGVAESTILEAYRGNVLCLRGNVHRCAKIIVSEGREHGPRFVKIRNRDWGSLKKKNNKLERDPLT